MKPRFCVASIIAVYEENHSEYTIIGSLINNKQEMMRKDAVVVSSEVLRVHDAKRVRTVSVPAKLPDEHNANRSRIVTA
jgi:hypothetical protein